VKKMKVMMRNLRKRELLPEFHDAKVIDFPDVDKINF
jgi:hypothetical protein